MSLRNSPRTPSIFLNVRERSTLKGSPRAFYVESRVEALERQVATRAKMTDVLNRSQDSKLRTRKKRDQAAMDIFDRKFEKEGNVHKETLKDHVAHYGVLRELAQERESSGKADPNMGRYGPGSSKLDIQPLIQRKIKDSTPSARRRKQSKKILTTRKNIKVFDRTKSTSALLKMKEKVASRPTSEQLRQISPSTMASEPERAGRGPGPGPSVSPRLILPPITVRWARHQIDHGLIRRAEKIQTKGGQGQQQQGSVFITDTRGWGRDKIQAKGQGQATAAPSSFFITDSKV